MKQKVYSLLFLAIQFIYLTACSTIDTSEFASYTPISEVNCDKKANKIHIFFQGETTNFEYEKVGLLELRDNYLYSSDGYDILKYTAWKNCANGIINLREEYVSVYNNVTETYESIKYYKGIAVKIDTNSNYFKNHAHENDLSFVAAVERTNQQVSESGRAKLGLGLFAVVIGGIVLLSLKN
jgi:hypothetical protein